MKCFVYLLKNVVGNWIPIGCGVRWPNNEVTFYSYDNASVKTTKFLPKEDESHKIFWRTVPNYMPSDLNL